MYKILLLFIGLTAFFRINASHIPGGNITYECLGNDQYVITLTLFEDCGTAFIANGPINIDVSNDCGITGLTQATLQNVIYAEEVSQLCDAQLPFSECNGNNMPGIYMHQWTDTLTLSDQCDAWTFSYEICCRNASDNVIGADGASFYIETTLNNQDAPCNSSPSVTTQMIPYICVNQPLIYNLGVYEPDGNTLVYSLIDGQNGGAGGALNYAPPNTGAAPIPGISINSSTGDLSFTPTQVGNYVVVVLVEEYDENGVLIGSLTQDFQFEVINCPANTNPVEPAGITNYSGDGVQLSSNEIEVCPGDQFCFQLEFTDLNAGDSIFISSNLDVALPGATFTQLTFQSPAVAEICWTATSTVPSNTSVVFNARDNACPMFGITFFPLSVFINPGTDAGPDVTLCAGDTTDLYATGGTSFTWEALPGGDPISVGNNFECETCQGTYALPSVTTQYEVTSDLTGLCSNKDTVEVEVVPDFAYTLSQSAETSCIGSDVSFELVMNPIDVYDIQWTPGSGLDDPNSATPVLTTSAPGNYAYAVSIESPMGCVRYDTLEVTVAPATSPDYEVLVSQTDLDCGDTVFFDVNILSAPPAICDLSINTICDGPESNYQVGSFDTQNTLTSWPAPFGNWYRNAKHQFLFTAAELLAAGLQPGKITEIAWDVTEINGDTIYYDYTINMGCTSTSDLNTWETGLSNVFTPQNVEVNLGTNTLVFSSAYEWDGVSNLVVEICYDNRHLNWSNNSVTPLTNTSFNSSLVYISDNLAACPAINVSQTSNQRPVTYFSNCSLEPDPNNFTFNWQSTADPVDDPASDSTFAIVSNDGDFEVFVTNLLGGCVDSTTISVTAECCGFDEVIIDDVTCFGGVDGGLSIIPYSNHVTTFEVLVTETSSGSTVYNQAGIVDTAFVNGLAAGDYTIQMMTNDGCMSDTSITIEQPVEFVVSIEGDSVMCIGDSLQLSADGGVVFDWTNAVSFADNSLDTVWYIGNTSEMIYLQATDATGCIAVDSLQMTVNALPMISLSNDTTICENDTTTLVASGGDSYTWTPNIDISTTMGSSVEVWPSGTAVYQVTVEDANGCLDSASVTVTIQSLPSIDAGPDIEICFGDTAILNGLGSDVNTWILGDSILDPMNEVTEAWPSTSNTYVLEGTDLLGCVNYDTMEVTVNSLPTVDAGSDLWVCPSSTVQLQGSSDGAVFSWTPTADLNDPSILMPDASPDDTTVYYLTVQSAVGCEQVDSMIVFAGGPVPTDAGINDTICEGDSVMIGAAPTAVAGTLFDWQPAASIVDNTLDNPVVYPSSDTWFVVNTANDTCTGVDSVFVKVHPYPLANAGADIAICIGDTAQLNATGGVSYSWNTETNLSDSTIADPIIYPTSTTDFSVTVTDALGCSQSDTMEVIVNPLPIADAGQNDTICFGDTTQLSASGGVGFLWSPNDSISDELVFDPSVWPSTTTDYIVEVTDANSCINADTIRIVVNPLPIVDAGLDLEMCIYDSIQLNVTGAVDYIWSPDSTLSQNDISNPFSNALDSETFVVLGTDANGCQNTDTMELIVHDLPIVMASQDTAICIYDTASIGATGALQYEWSPSADLAAPNDAMTLAYPQDTTVYIVEGTDANGCVNVDSLILTVDPLPIANAGIDVDICRGDSTQLTASGGESYYWTPMDSIVDENVFNPIVYPDTTTEYIVTVVDSNACVNYDSVNVNVFRVATIPDTSICLTDSIQLAVYGSPGNQFVWTPSDGLSESNLPNPMASPENSTTYTVTVSDVAGCVDQASVNITVFDIPIIGFSYVLTPDCDGVLVEFSDSSSYADDYRWSFSNGQEVDDIEPTTLFEYDSEAGVDLLLSNDFGCSTDSTFAISLTDFDSFYDIHIPNVFTPNGDGQNDYFWVQVPGNLAECLDLKVYNRWGMLIFNSFGGITAWDGKNSDGDEVPDGTYMFTIEIEDYTYEGTVTIFR
ncbi:gliding motility-associated C-terminal domain-containing protein [Parvicella tangerina]|uniref:Gliding motility-associated C-terminal domain-containing protein n=1 Tax=Parvicella tangerina TaxID=2829795 RepID=A0A916JK29_9FLAO|nr:gliding motility-associated C-terminal domain-containing protein [Parvicella tangerina]CAG5078240.1 hypothetical protein CRYO30217_00617 [Parvicella tangerina]